MLPNAAPRIIAVLDTLNYTLEYAKHKQIKRTIKDNNGLLDIWEHFPVCSTAHSY